MRLSASLLMLAGVVLRKMKLIKYLLTSCTTKKQYSYSVKIRWFFVVGRAWRCSGDDFGFSLSFFFTFNEICFSHVEKVHTASSLRHVKVSLDCFPRHQLSLSSIVYGFLLLQNPSRTKKPGFDVETSFVL